MSRLEMRVKIRDGKVHVRPARRYTAILVSEALATTFSIGWSIFRASGGHQGLSRLALLSAAIWGFNTYLAYKSLVRARTQAWKLWDESGLHTAFAAKGDTR